MTRDEFDSRITRCRRSLMMVAQNRLPHDVSEDAVQSAILSAWEHLDDLHSDAAFDSWIRQILLNECSAYYRKRTKESAAAEALATSQTHKPDGIGLDDALEELSEAEKRLLLLHHDEGYSVSELATQSGETESVIKMRLYRARKRLRAALISVLLLLLLLVAAAIGTGYLDVNWFLAHRRVSNPPLLNTDSQPDFSIAYDGQFLSAEISDARWNINTLSLLFTCSLAGTSRDILTVHSGNIGVDGERLDHIWIDGQILPVAEWADGKEVYRYSLEDWKLDGNSLTGSEDSLADGYGESFFTEVFLDAFTPEQLTMLVAPNGYITLTCRVFIYDHPSGMLLEEGNLTARIAAPDTETWRTAYEAYVD